MDEESWQEVSDFASTSSSTGHIPTPTSTLSTISEPMPLTDKDILKNDQKLRPSDYIRALGNQPIADRTFLIRSREEPHLLLTVCNGAVKCLPKPIPGGGSFWRCVKKDGWYGFRNTVSGAYLGYDREGKMCAKQPYQLTNEYLTIDWAGNGGYILHVLENSTSLYIGRRQVSISEDGKSLVAKKEGGTVWDFIDSRYYQMSSSLVYPGLQPEKLR